MSDKRKARKKATEKATKKDREDKIFDVFLEERLIPVPINHRLSKTASLWKINSREWDQESYNASGEWDPMLDTHWVIKPHHPQHHVDKMLREEISTDELFKLIFHQSREPTKKEKQQMNDRMGAELRAFMGTPPVGGVREIQDRAVVFPDNTHSKCRKTLTVKY